MSDWGDDPLKWVVKKCDFGYGWVAFPPHNGEPIYFQGFPFDSTLSNYLQRRDSAGYEPGAATVEELSDKVRTHYDLT